jgi:hypothetical protein
VLRAAHAIVPNPTNHYIRPVNTRNIAVEMPAATQQRFQVAMESPCIKVCVIDPVSGLCQGCHRTLSEIAGWASISQSERQRIMNDLPVRRKLTRQGG